MKPIVVLYHRGCNDGIVAAWAARRRLGDAAKYIPYQYGEELPAEVWGSHLIMVDLSMPEEQLQKVRHEVLSVLIIDHHKTARPLQAAMRPVKTYQEYLRHRTDMDQLMIMFDEEHSGAVLAWAFFNDIARIQQESMPMALQLIEDYDLWKHEYPESKAVNAWLINGGLSMDRVEELMSNDGEIPAEVLAVGKALLRYDDKIIKSVLREYVQVIEFDDGTKCAMVNAPHHLRNEIGERLSDKFDFVALYTQRKERIVYSLRSKNYDVSKIAEAFGGGGHAQAAAYSIPNGAQHKLLSRGAFVKPTFRNRLVAAWDIITGKVA